MMTICQLQYYKAVKVFMVEELRLFCLSIYYLLPATLIVNTSNIINTKLN